MNHIIIKIIYKVQNLIIKATIKLFFKPLIYSSDIKKVIVFRTGSIGDSICALPALHAIRNYFNNAHISLLTVSGKSKELSLYNLASLTLYNNYFDYSDISKLQLIKQLHKQQYDLYIELPQTFSNFKTNLRNIIIAKFIGAKYAFGWQVYANTFFKKTQNVRNKFEREPLRLLNILKNNGISSTLDEKYLLNISINDELFVTNLFKETGINTDKKTIAFVIGAKRFTNRWPVEYFAEIAQYLFAYNIFIIGGKEDDNLAKKICLTNNVYNFTGKLSIMQSAVILKHCILTIANDTGPMHLSYAVGTPVIALFSNRDYPIHWYPPYNGNNFVFRANNIDCCICLKEICPYNNKCMRAITPEMVIEKIKTMLPPFNK